MATMLGNTYAALIEAGASPQAAQKAAEELAGYDNKFAALDLKIEQIGGRLTLVQWQLAVLIAGVSALIIKAFV